MTATSAARDAANRDDFFDAAEAVVGVRARAAVAARRRGGCRSSAPPPSSIPPTARSSWSTSAAAPPSSPTAPPSAEAAISIDMGCVRITEKCLHSDPPTAEELSQAALGRRGPPRRRVREHPGARPRRATFVGLAGTVSTAAAVEIGLAEYDRDRIHHFRPHEGRGRGRVPHPRHRAARRPHRTTRASSASGPTSSSAGCACSCRSCAGSASASAWCRRPTSSTAWRCRSPSGSREPGRRRSRRRCRLPHPARGRVARIAAP